MQKIDLSICIVNYNAEQFLGNCLKSIYQSADGIDFEIIVVDNNSIDGSRAMVKEKFSKVRLVKNAKNIGFARANNQAIKASSGKYILLLNHDTLLYSGALLNLVDFMDKHPEAGACGAKLLNSDGSIQHQCKRGFPTPLSILFYITGLSKLFPKSKKIGHYLMTHLNPEEINEVDALSGACMMVRRKVIEEVGLLDESFFMYGEDLDWCYRIKKRGWKIYYVPQAEIVHFGGVGSKIANVKSNIEYHRSMYIFYRKHYAKKRLFLINWGIYSGITLKGLFALITNFFRKEKIVGTKK